MKKFALSAAAFLVIIFSPSILSFEIDSDGDGLFDREEIEIFRTDPNSPDSDGDGFNDGVEVSHGFDPVRGAGAKLIAPEIFEKVLKNRAEISTENWNSFETPDGLFRLKFANFLEPKKIDGIYFFQTLRDKKVVFQIFENAANLNFAKENFRCAQKNNREVCFSQNFDRNLISDLEIFVEPNLNLKKIAAKFAEKKAISAPREIDRFRFFSRAEALSVILKLKFPEKNFSAFAGNCFDDVKSRDWFSGAVCFAKKKKIVNGIGGNFYPDSSVNLWGILQFCFRVFENDDRVFRDDFFAPGIFSQMQKIHAAYEIVGKSLFEGIFWNLRDEEIWANRAIFFGEGLEIIDRFLKFNSGEKLRNYDPREISAENLDSAEIFFAPRFEFFDFKSAENLPELSPAEIRIEKVGTNWEIFRRARGNFFEKFFVSNCEPEKPRAVFDSVKLRGGVKFFCDGKLKIFRTEIGKNQFEVLRGFHEFSGSKREKEILEKRELLPNPVNETPVSSAVAQMKIFLSDRDFLEIFENRTANTRRRAFLEIIFPDGEVQRRSILIKTRGNASRGYVKSSFTIEASKNFAENENLAGDEFLEFNDEFKMRAFIGEPTRLREKLFYRAAKEFEIPAPDFFPATAEINGVKLGLFQITEPVKKPFFEHRGIFTEEFFYARNSGAIFDTNLQFYESDETTASQYKIKTSPAALLNLIRNLEADDPAFLEKIDTENVFNFATLVFVSGASDSLTHNFYVFFDEKTGKWKIFPWDADATFEFPRRLLWQNLLKFARAETGNFNNLIRFVFTHTPEEKLYEFYEKFQKKFRAKVKLENWAKIWREKLREFLKFDNNLWNGKFLERKMKTVDSEKEIEKLQRSLQKLKF